MEEQHGRYIDIQYVDLEKDDIKNISQNMIQTIKGNFYLEEGFYIDGLKKAIKNTEKMIRLFCEENMIHHISFIDKKTE